LVREDFVWWLDWVVAAVISFGVLVLSRAHDHGSLNTLQACGLLATFALGLLFVPTFVRNRGYDKDATPPVRKVLPGIVVPNVFGAVLLIAAVSSGASLVG
jgi:drug/metabolite transporter (DMT)-like permease